MFWIAKTQYLTFINFPNHSDPSVFMIFSTTKGCLVAFRSGPFFVGRCIVYTYIRQSWMFASHYNNPFSIIYNRCTAQTDLIVSGTTNLNINKYNFFNNKI